MSIWDDHAGGVGTEPAWAADLKARGYRYKRMGECHGCGMPAVRIFGRDGDWPEAWICRVCVERKAKRDADVSR